MIRKLGFNPKDLDEFEQAKSVLIYRKVILETSPGSKTYTMWPQLCLMTKNATVQEYVDCREKDPQTHILKAPVADTN